MLQGSDVGPNDSLPLTASDAGCVTPPAPSSDEA
jgi:hypothetical protein